ncbi:hypothetical protein EV363DRAFT_1418714 [Boletus edulis]|uniref:DUF6533 domain-containing protein n=1 Tax=Boletus edulis BED1 TaxID=1328754 RepID=A0AAD4C9V4_BOLED|nr:hypothetical protein EV363DRAFT_1418714 [Boletus edulis]KAF8452764.1 hypothetical protein L210DRAFT_3626780 [Boletus edulis BED1]
MKPLSANRRVTDSWQAHTVSVFGFEFALPQTPLSLPRIMSSDVQSALASLQLNDYTSLVIVIAVSYDYCLTFAKEVTYIWKGRWTWVSALYLLTRYVGYLSVVTAALLGSSFISGPAKVRTRMYLLGVCAYTIFWTAADMVMILRVYVMYDCSKIILSVILVIYIAEVVTLFIRCGIDSNPNYLTVSILQLFDITICNFVVLNTQVWINASTVFQFILGAVLCILVAAKSMRHSLQIQPGMQHWKMNRYMSLLFRDGLAYFLVERAQQPATISTLFHNLFVMLGDLGTLPNGWITQVLVVAADVPLYTLTPRFVMSVRELYAVDSQGRSDIDTGFGLTNEARRGIGASTTIGMIVFAEGGATSGMVDGEEMANVEEREGSDDRQITTISATFYARFISVPYLYISLSSARPAHSFIDEFYAHDSPDRHGEINTGFCNRQQAVNTCAGHTSGFVCAIITEGSIFWLLEINDMDTENQHPGH